MKSTALKGVTIAALVGLAGACSAPRWMVFQKKVDPAMAETPSSQAEAQKQAAAFISDVTAPPVPEPAKTVERVHEVATGLSASLGEPKKRLTSADYEAALASLRSGLQAKDAQLERWREFGRKYAGTPLEDTGINLAGPAGLLGLAGVIALCVAVPPIGYALLRLLPLLWGFFRRTTEAVSEFARSDPEAGERLAVKLGTKMDAVHKKLVRARAGTERIPRSPSSP
jgi:hypothetical protein